MGDDVRVSRTANQATKTPRLKVIPKTNCAKNVNRLQKGYKAISGREIRLTNIAFKGKTNKKWL